MGFFKKNDEIEFVGREEELSMLHSLLYAEKPAIAVVYGRRRVGKTALIQKAFRKERLFRFEGLEGVGSEGQRAEFLRQLSEAVKEPSLTQIKPKSWTETLAHLNRHLPKGRCVLYLEELQWMACYQTELVSAIKYYWDNFWSKKRNLLIVLCGSAPSFMINGVLRSKALYNRSEVDFPLSPFSLAEAKAYMGESFSLRDTMDAILCVGAIPPYLEKLKSRGSIYQNLINQASSASGYFVNEYEKIFTSSLATSPDYRRIIDALTRAPYLDRKGIQAKIKRGSGGSLSNILEDLELCGFISSYTPVGKSLDGKLKRYVLADPYVRFYHRFIKTKLRGILSGTFRRSPELVAPIELYFQHLAYSFERWLLANQVVLASLLGFQRVSYSCGPYFSRAIKSSQVDLVFERADRVTSIVEIKYTDKPVTKSVIREMESKIALYPKKGRRLERVLVSAAGVESSVVKAGFFDLIVSLEELFKESSR